MGICLDKVAGGKERRETKQSAGCMTAFGARCIEIHPLMDDGKDALRWRGGQGERGGIPTTRLPTLLVVVG